MATKDINKAIVKEQFFVIGKINQDAVKAKDAYRKRLADLKAQKENYTDEYLKELQGKARAELAASNTTLHSRYQVELEKLKTALLEMHGQLDLADPALVNAVGIIKSVGPGLNSESVLRINAQFDNQSALKLLQSAYKAAGMSYDGGLDRRIYNAESVLQEVENSAHAAFTQEGGSINALAGKVAKLAALEGHEFEKNPDPVGMDESLRAAAGLPVGTTDTE